MGFRLLHFFIEPNIRLYSCKMQLTSKIINIVFFVCVLSQVYGCSVVQSRPVPEQSSHSNNRRRFHPDWKHGRYGSWWTFGHGIFPQLLRRLADHTVTANRDILRSARSTSFSSLLVRSKSGKLANSEKNSSNGNNLLINRLIAVKKTTTHTMMAAYTTKLHLILWSQIKSGNSKVKNCASTK